MNNRKLAETTTDPAILDELSKDENYYVRYEVAYNRNTTPETLDFLSKDEDCLVRCYVAENPNTTSETLKEMSKVETASYVKTAIKNRLNGLGETRRYFLAVPIIQYIVCNEEGKI